MPCWNEGPASRPLLQLLLVLLWREGTGCPLSLPLCRTLCMTLELGSGHGTSISGSESEE